MFSEGTKKKNNQIEYSNKIGLTPQVSEKKKKKHTFKVIISTRTTRIRSTCVDFCEASGLSEPEDLQRSELVHCKQEIGKKGSA